MNDDAAALAALGWRPEFSRQLTLDELSLDAAQRPVPARVAAVERDLLRVLTAGGEQPLAWHGDWHQRPAEQRPTVGDWVLLDATGARLLRLLDRASLFARRAAGPVVERQLIAANVDVAVLVSACNRDFNIRRLERYLAVALEAAALPVVVLTRADLVDDPQPWLDAVRGLRVDLVTLAVNATDPAAVAPLGTWIGPGRTAVLLGSSGVGKSTLTNALLGRSTQATGAIRADDQRGRHTTTSRRLLRIPDGGWIIDGPGMRELQLSDVADGLDAVFADIDALAAQCRFVDCVHGDEPGCAVRAAVDAGALDPARLASRARLQREERFNAMTLAERHATARAFGRRVRGSVEAKQARRGGAPAAGPGRRRRDRDDD